jgi:protein ImuB
VVLREPLGDAVRIQRVLGHRILRLPAPAETLSLAVEQFGPRGGEQGELFDGGSAQRRIRTSAGIRQARVVGGPEAILRVRSVQPDSHIAERRDVLTPYEP